MWAADSGKREVVEILLGAGAEPGLKDDQCMTGSDHVIKTNNIDIGHIRTNT